MGERSTFPGELEVVKSGKPGAWTVCVHFFIATFCEFPASWGVLFLTRSEKVGGYEVNQ